MRICLRLCAKEAGVERAALNSIEHIDGVLPANQARSRDARDRLLKAGERVFARMGYDSAHVTDIAAAADCSVGSFYRRFRDKEAFFKALHHRFTALYRENTGRFFEMPQWRDQPSAVVIKRFIEATARIMNRNEGFFRALFQRSLAGAGKDFWPQMRKGGELQGRALAAFLAARGEGTHEDMAGASVLILRVVEGSLVHRMLNEGVQWPGEAHVIEQLTRMVVTYLGLEDSGPRQAKPLSRKRVSGTASR
jgi:AcrR family transcriptional regulator